MRLDIQREAAWHYLCSLKNIGLTTVKELIGYSGGLMEVLGLTSEQTEKLLKPAMQREWCDTEDFRRHYLDKYEEIKDKNYRFISIEHPEFPSKLKEISNPPNGIWVKGRLLDNEKSVAVIGSRACTDYGLDMASLIGRRLADWNIGVVSGMALGIDAAAQHSALCEGGYSLAVLGCGIDICYPASNIELYEMLTRNGGIITEFPPGRPGLPAYFRFRNRLISGMSDSVIVVEAQKKSGTQLTVSWALDQGREVYAVPGRFTDSFSSGCNQMIEQGAGIICSMKSLAENLGVEYRECREKSEAISLEEKKIYDILSTEIQHFETILIKSGYETKNLWKVLFSLESKKIITQPIKNYYKKNVFL